MLNDKRNSLADRLLYKKTVFILVDFLTITRKLCRNFNSAILVLNSTLDLI